jgi:acetyl esterase/lipase
MSAFVLAPAARAQDSPASMFGGEAVPPSLSYKTVRYGEGRDRSMTIYRARSRQAAPVLVFFNDIGWQSGANFYDMSEFVRALNDRGIAVVFVKSYEDRIGADVQNISTALKLLGTIAPKHRLDLSRLAVLGRGSGGHFAALLATNPKLLTSASLEIEALRSAIIIDGEGFDVSRLLSARPRDAKLQEYFGLDLATQQEHSPVAQLSSPNAPSFYFVNYGGAELRAAPVNDFARAVETSGGAKVVVRTTLTADGDIGGKRFGWPGNRTSDDLIRMLVDVLK